MTFKITNDLRKFTDLIEKLREFAFAKPLLRSLAIDFLWVVGAARFDRKTCSKHESEISIDLVMVLNAEEISI
jgi:hypothetical protein